MSHPKALMGCGQPILEGCSERAWSRRRVDASGTASGCGVCPRECGRAVPSIYSSARPELDWSPVCRHHAYMISSFVRGLISAFKARRELSRQCRCTFYLFIRAQPNLISLRSAGTMLASFRRSLTPWRTLVEAQFESKLRASRRPRRTWTRTC